MIVIGMDQCGAKGRRIDQAKPLPIVILILGEAGIWQTHLGYLDELSSSNKPLTLSRLDFDLISKLCQSSVLALDGAKVCGPIIVAMDCVLGLPKSVYSALVRSGKLNGKSYQKDLQELMHFALARTQKSIAQGKHGYGFQLSLEFFDALLEPSGHTRQKHQAPRRGVEKVLCAQSLFSPYPFQRNIQTGTFRIWSDLAYNLSCGRKFDIWPFTALSKDTKQILLCEAYPSYFWKKDFKQKSRHAPALIETIKDGLDFPVDIDLEQLSRLGADHLDALVNALGVIKRLDILKHASTELIEGSIVL